MDSSSKLSNQKITTTFRKTEKEKKNKLNNKKPFFQLFSMVPFFPCCSDFSRCIFLYNRSHRAPEQSRDPYQHQRHPRRVGEPADQGEGPQEGHRPAEKVTEGREERQRTQEETRAGEIGFTKPPKTNFLRVLHDQILCYVHPISSECFFHETGRLKF